MMVSVDVYRPAARDQLAVLAKQLKLPIYPGVAGETKPLDWHGARQAIQDRQGCPFNRYGGPSAHR